MISDSLLNKIKRLNENAKLELVHLLIEDLKLSGTAYEIFTPFGNEAAARILQLELEKDHVDSQPEVE